MNNFFGAISQAYLAGGLTGVSRLGQTIGRNIGVYSSTVSILHKGSLGSWAIAVLTPKTEIMVTKDGRLYTPQTLAREATRHGIGASFIKAEVARTLSEEIRSSDAPLHMKLMSLFTGNDILSRMYVEWAQTTVSNTKPRCRVNTR